MGLPKRTWTCYNSSMKLRPGSESMYVSTVGQCTRLINGTKKALKHAEDEPLSYTEDEVRHLKRSLRDLYEQRKYLNSGNGFGND